MFVPCLLDIVSIALTHHSQYAKFDALSSTGQCPRQRHDETQAPKAPRANTHDVQGVIAGRHHFIPFLRCHSQCPVLAGQALYMRQKQHAYIDVAIPCCMDQCLQQYLAISCICMGRIKWLSQKASHNNVSMSVQVNPRLISSPRSGKPWDRVGRPQGMQ